VKSFDPASLKKCNLVAIIFGPHTVLSRNSFFRNVELSQQTINKNIGPYIEDAIYHVAKSKQQYLGYVARIVLKIRRTGEYLNN